MYKRQPLGYAASDFKIATFEEVLDAFPDTPINVDMKSSGSDPSISLAAADALAAIMNAHPERREDVIVASFDQDALERFHELAPGHKALSGSEDASVTYAFGGPLSPVPVAIQPPDLFNLNGNDLRTVPILREPADYDGFAIHAWGSGKDPAEETDPFYAQLIEEGADGFFTQVPGKLHQYLCEAGVRRPDGSQHCSAQAPDLSPKLRFYSFKGPKRLRAGKSASFKILLGNTGNAVMTGLKACITVSKKARKTIKVPACVRAGKVRPGGLFRRKMRIRTTRRAKGKVGLRVEVEAVRTDPKSVRRSILIRR